MRNIFKLLFTGFFSLSILTVSAQLYTGFSDATIVLKSDTSTRSALISNLLEDRVGDISPIIGTAAWRDNDKNLQCRSLLFFDYGLLPKMLRPEQITEAILILKPVEIPAVETRNGTYRPQFAVRRITEPWEDSMTSWITQPASDPNDQVTKSIAGYKKGKTVKIDVTEIVKNMFRYGNNGFMIRYEDSLETTAFLSQWFASARYDEKKLRPELVIKWSYPSNYYPVPKIDMAELSSSPAVRTPVPYQQPQHQGHVPVKMPVNDTPPVKGGTKD